jgi:hypothetical protein
VSSAVSRTWNAIRDQFTKEAAHLQLVHIPEPGAAALRPRDSYLRLSLSELFLADERKWGTDRLPAVQVSARLQFGGPRQQTFTTLVQPTVTTGRGVFEDCAITHWVPYYGQAIELEAALYQIDGKNNLLTAIQIVSDFASLVTPPVSAVLAVADKVASGIEKITKANAADPALVLHKALTEPAAGWIAVVRATEDKLPAAELHVDGQGRLCRNGVRLTGFDYMVLHVQSLHERDDWWTPDLDEAVRLAAVARAQGRPEYDRLREEALALVLSSPDLTPPQRRQAAVAVKEELDLAGVGAVADGGMTVAEIIARHGLPSRQQVEHLTLADLIAYDPR